MKRIILYFGGVLSLVLCGCAIASSRLNTETPACSVVRAEGDFEVREYPAMTLATTAMTGGEMNGSFMRLFRFIDGGNERKEKISMTTPVLVERKKDASTMSFIVPKATVDKGAPKPAAPEVTLAQQPPVRVVAMRFGGARSAAAEKAALEKLTSWAAGQKVATTGDALFAYYDPPWTPAMLRRNEVMLRLK